MKRIVCSVRDRAASTFAAPFLVVAVGQALRSFRDEVNRQAPDNQLYLHPEDFDLFELGTFDDNTGAFELLPHPRQVGIGKDLSERIRAN